MALSFGVLEAGYVHRCALTSTAQAYCWGFNGSGQLGAGTTTNSTKPVSVTGGRTFGTVGSGGYHTYALSGGTAYRWGANHVGQLGTGTMADRTRPVPVAAP